MPYSDLARYCPNLSSNIMGVTTPTRSVKAILTITSRNAGSRVPANVRFSLYRYEIEMYFSGFFKVSVAT